MRAEVPGDFCVEEVGVVLLGVHLRDEQEQTDD